MLSDVTPAGFASGDDPKIDSSASLAEKADGEHSDCRDSLSFDAIVAPAGQAHCHSRVHLEPTLEDSKWHAYDPYDLETFCNPTVVVLHMFSGPSRQLDLQQYLKMYSRYSEYTICVVSIDIGVQPLRSDLRSQKTLAFWRSKISSVWEETDTDKSRRCV